MSGKEIRGFVYEKSFDQRYVAHLLEILLSIIQFGGQGFSKSARGTFLRRSYDHVLLQRLSSGNDYHHLAVVVLTICH